MNESRTLNTPLHKPLNPTIRRLLQAINWHNAHYFSSGDQWHLDRAVSLCTYLRQLKDRIHEEEQKVVPPLS